MTEAEGTGAGTTGGSATHPVLLFARRTPEEQRAVLRQLTRPQKRELTERWWRWAHEGQHWPDGAWALWLILAGRGFGKTRAGSEWVGAMARAVPGTRIALVGGSIDEVRQVMIEGPSGLITVAHDEARPVWRADAGELRFANGSIAFVYSAHAPESLRGPEHHYAWCDELAKWRVTPGEAAWDNLMLGLRLGEQPRVLVTTTPRAGALMTRVASLAEERGSIMRGGTRDNLHLPPSFVAAMVSQYEGTRLGRQELDGELIEDVEGALWSRALIEGCRVRAVPGLVRVVVGVDPPAGTASGTGGDACGIVAVALGEDGRGYVLDDASVRGGSPERWAAAVAACAARWDADRVVAEANNGGAMVKSVLTAADAMLPIKLVRASHGKVARAEPVMTLYQRGKVAHVGAFAALEDELCGLTTGGGYAGPGRSPDRADALVWALTELMLRATGAARVSGL